MSHSLPRPVSLTTSIILNIAVLNTNIQQANLWETRGADQPT